MGLGERTRIHLLGPLLQETSKVDPVGSGNEIESGRVRGYDDQGNSEAVCLQTPRTTEHGPVDRLPFDELGEPQSLQSTIVLCEVVIRLDEHGRIVVLNCKRSSIRC